MVDYDNEIAAVKIFKEDSLFAVAIKKFFQEYKFTYSDVNAIHKKGMLMNRRIPSLTRPFKLDASRLVTWCDLLNAEVDVKFKMGYKTSDKVNLKYRLGFRTALKRLLDDLDYKELHKLSKDSKQFTIYELLKFKNSLNLTSRELSNERLNSICQGFNLECIIVIRKDDTEVTFSSKEYYENFQFVMK